MAATAVATPAHAQFPNIFEQLFQPPRPPADVPLPPPGTQPQRQQGLPPGPPPRRQQSRLPPGPPPGRIQQEPLGPPDGQQQLPPPGQRGTVAPPTANTPPPQPTNTEPQPGDEIIMEPPAQKVDNPTAVFSGLDKITGRIINFEVAINETVRFGALEVTPRVCYTRPLTMAANTDGFIEVDELTLQGELRRIFTGWMFAASPGLNAVEHPIYDVWLTDCKGAKQPEIAEAPPEPEPAAEKPAPAPPPRRAPPPPRRAPQQSQPLPPPGTQPLPPPGTSQR